MIKHSASLVPSVVLFFTVILQLLSTPLMGRDKTDVVILKNGDRLTGEIKKLERGKLRFSTDYMGTVDIEWPEIERLTSQYFFEVEVETGERVFGSLRPTPGQDEIDIVGERSTATLEQLSVVRLTPLEDDFLARLQGYMDVGFSFTRANRATQWSLGAEVNSRTEQRQIQINLSSLFNSREDLDSTTRNVLGLDFTRFFSDRWLVSALAQFTQNEELALDLRSIVGGAVGRHLIQTNRSTLTLRGGTVFTRERFTGPDPGRSNAELFAGMEYDLFSFGHPETDITTTLAVFPNLSDWGRLRVDLESRIRHELFKDFFWSISLFDNFDSDPALEAAKRNDFGITTSLGWSF